MVAPYKQKVQTAGGWISALNVSFPLPEITEQNFCQFKMSIQHCNSLFVILFCYNFHAHDWQRHVHADNHLAPQKSEEQKKRVHALKPRSTAREDGQ